ncbi:MAG TPA: alpha-amylase family glycosyl hydrolase [Acidobacteriaceae bacterium]|nr:alpha-amylase family glycosyl hydrolase [Acidobacteriaceae bacterium]
MLCKLPFRRKLRPALCQLAILLVFCVTVPGFARTHAKKRANRAPEPGKPSVQETDPPNWWSNLPNPMLLLHGKNLTDAHVSTSVPGISVRRTRISSNGHWAFVWLDIASAPPQHFDLIVRTPGGTTRTPYELDARHAPTDGFQGFSSSDVMYLIMPDRFADGDPSNDRLPKSEGTYDVSKPRAYHGGDLRGIQDHLDYIQQLGVTTVWITPLYANDPLSAGDYHGYGAVQMFGINPHFGTLKDYQDLAQALHGRGMKLVLDTVPNHVGPKNPWVLDPPAPDWFHGTLAHHMEANGNFAPITDPHAPPAAYRPAVDGWFANVLPDLDQSNPLVRKYLIQNAIWWIESGTLDGLRLDTFPYVDRAFWQDFHSVLRALYPHLTTVGEIFNPDPTIVSYFAGGVKHSGVDTGLYTPFDFPTYFALRQMLTGTTPDGDQPMTRLSEVQRQDWLYPHPERLVTFLGNHDTTRFMSEPGATADRMKLAFGLLATMRGMPQIYSGDEIAMTGGKDPENRHDFPGGFSQDRTDASAKDAFTAAGRTPEQEAMHAWVQGLMQLRAKHEALKTGAQQDLLVDDTGLVFARIQVDNTQAGQAAKPVPVTGNGETLLVLMNKSGAPRTFHLDFSHTALTGTQSLNPLWNTKDQVSVSHNAADVDVGANQLVIMEVQR